MELCYRNNTKSLFRKYARFVTWFANTGIGRDYLLHNNLYLPKNVSVLLPNGYIEHDGKHAQLTVTTRPVYASKIYPALQALESFTGTMRETQELLLWYLGQRYQPSWAKSLNATLTVNPDANPESTSVDGYVKRTGVTENWATIRAGAGNNSSDTVDGSDGTAIRLFSNGSSGTSGNLQELARSITLFDTSALGEGATVESAIASVYKLNHNVSAPQAPQLNLVLCSPSANTSLTNSDFNIANWTMTLQSDTSTAFTAISNSAYVDYALNATGIGNVQISGITKFGWVSHYDKTNTDPSFTVNSDDERMTFEFADHASGNDPKLAITYTPGITISDGGSFLLNFV